MNTTHLWLGIGLFVGLSGTCLATPPVSQDVIHIQGRIVEPGCKTSTRMGVEGRTTINLADCPAQAPGNVISVQH